MHALTINKSLLTNLVALGFVLLGLTSIQYSDSFYNMGLFALSGALTNWIAIHMLFEKVPGFYGSGVIQLRFGAFKAAIKNMIMHEFFRPDLIAKVMQSPQSGTSLFPKDANLIDKLDLNRAFEVLVGAIEQSSFGGMLAMFGGTAALEPLRLPVIDKMKQFIQDEILSKKDDILSSSLSPDLIKEKIEHMVDSRLNDLTPLMVKVLVQNMIHEHLGWLVVWGGVFGGLIGLAKELLQLFV